MKQLRGLTFRLQLLYLVLFFRQRLVRSPRGVESIMRISERVVVKKDLSSQGPRTLMVLRLGAYRVVMKYISRIKDVLVFRNMEERERLYICRR